MVDIEDINTFVVIGAGTMGREIAQVALMAGFEKVILNDITQEATDVEKSKSAGHRRTQAGGEIVPNPSG